MSILHDILNTNWYLLGSVTIVLIGFIIDHNRLEKENIILMANPDTIIGTGIIKAIQAGEDLQGIINQIRQMNIDDSRQVANVYGENYSKLLELLK